MQFERTIHFYAAHRNQHLVDQCAGLHGHRYEITYQVEVIRGLAYKFDISIPFAELKVAEAGLANHYDHTMLIDAADPLLNVLNGFVDGDVTGPLWRLRVMPFPTSLENMAFVCFRHLKANMDVVGAVLVSIRMKETDSTTLIYDADDYRKDLVRFSDKLKEWRT